MIETVGSICSGIEAASVAWENLNWKFEWFSEIAKFPSEILEIIYPATQNIGDINNIPELLRLNQISSPDLICGGTPCQAFSLAGSQNGLTDERGNLTLKFVDIVEANDNIRLAQSKDRSTIFWENVEGVLTDKTNAFGCLICSLAGMNNVIEKKKWPNSGILKGIKRNIAWRVLDAKFFGLPHQRKRLYLIATDKKYNPENILFEKTNTNNRNDLLTQYNKTNLVFKKEKHKFEIFRNYTDCLYSAYGTKWNGNAAAYNGSLFVVQDGKIRRLSPLECERLMGLPDNYTNINGAKRTNRYQAIGNSWAVPVIKWLGNRIDTKINDELNIAQYKNILNPEIYENDVEFYKFEKELTYINKNNYLNTTTSPNDFKIGSMKDIITAMDVPNQLFISPVGCFGMVRRKRERNINMNKRLETILLNCSSEMTSEEIEKRSQIQTRGKFSQNSNECEKDISIQTTKNNIEIKQFSFFDL